MGDDINLARLYGSHWLPYFACVNPILNGSYIDVSDIGQGPDPQFGNVPNGYPYSKAGTNLGLLEMPLDIKPGEKIDKIPRFNIRAPVDAIIVGFEGIVDLNLIFTGSARVKNVVFPPGSRAPFGRTYGGESNPVFQILAIFMANDLADPIEFDIWLFYKTRIVAPEFSFNSDQPHRLKVTFEIYNPLIGNNNCAAYDIVNNYSIDAFGNFMNPDNPDQVFSPHSNYLDYPPLSLMMCDMI